jgi:hypothetical protein
VQAGFLAPFPDAQFAAAEATSSAGNRTYFTVTAATATADQGGAVLQAALQAAGQQLLDVQRAVQAPDDALFIVIQSTPVDGPVESYPDRARAVGAIALGGLAAGIVLIVLLDLVLSAIGAARRRRARARDGADTGTTQGTGTGGATAADAPAVPASEAPAGPAEPVDVRERAGSTPGRRP